MVEAYSPLAHGEAMDNPVLRKIGKRYGKSNAQIFLRWSIQHGCVPIPKSAHPARIAENLQVFDFEILAEDMKAIDAMNEDLYFTYNPNLIA